MSAAVPAKRLPDPAAGVRRKIGPYVIERQLGSGASGTVFLGRDPANGRVAALKTLSPELGADRERLEVYRYLQLGGAGRARPSAHPGVVDVYDVIEHDHDVRDATGGRGRVSIAMEYVEGTDLAARLADPEPLPLAFVARVVREVAAALDHVHEQGLRHRDIKPANILLAADGSARMADFGIASLAGEDLSDDLARLGSPNYLAPERVLSVDSDHRVDVYALGAVLYEMLTRQPPFSGDSVAELLHNISAGPLVPVSELRPNVPEELDAIVAKALAREPAERFQTAGELARTLDRFVDRQARHSDTVPTAQLGASDGQADRQIDEPMPEEDASRLETGGVELELPVVEPPAGADIPKRSGRRRSGVLAVAAVLGLGVAALVFLFGRPSEDGPTDQPTANAAGPDTQYLGLLEESRRLYAAGEIEAAEKLLRRAEELSPDRARIRQLRETARAEVASEKTALREAAALDRLDTARSLIDRGRLREASREVAAALELVPGHGEAERLRAYVQRLRSQQAARRAAAAAAAGPPESQAENPVPELPAPAPPTVSEEALPANGDLRIDFYSEAPRGVLTVYVNGTQRLNRAFRFVEKKSLLRRKGRSGGFDERIQLPAGDLSLRVYLSLPGQAAQMETLSGPLKGGSLRTLRARVDSSGKLGVEFY